VRDHPLQRHPIIAWFAGNPVVANVIMFSILAAGVYTAIKVRKETFPSFDAQRVEVRVPFLGGTPEDVERGVTIKIEEALQKIEGIDHIRSVSRESGSTVTISALEDYPIDELLKDIKIQVDAIPSFPEEAEKPVISESRRIREIVWIDIHGDVPEATLKETARTVRDELLKLDNISRINVHGSRNYELSIEISEDKLRTYNLTFDEVARAVSNNSIDLSGGVIRSERGEISIRTRSQAYTTREFEDLPLRTTAEGIRIHLRDVATVRDGFIDQKFLNRFNGQPTVSLQIITEGRDNTIQASAAARTLAAEFGENFHLPAGVQLTPWNDSSEVIKSRLNLMIKNGLIGVGLVFIVLALFLNLKLAFWVAVGIPVSMCGALTLFPLEFLDLSLNQITTFAFIVVLGIVVDDAIIIGESIYASKEAQKSREGSQADLRATVRGVSKVFIPAAFGVLTTIAAFYPLTRVSGQMGNIFGTMAVVVIFCLIFSLVESKIILPSHLAHIDVHKKSRNPLSRLWDFIQGGVAGALRYFITRIYQPGLKILIPYRYAVTGVFIAILIIVGGLLPSGYLRFVWFPPIYRDNITATLELEQGLPVEHLHQSCHRIETALRKAARELEEESGHKILRHVHISASNSTTARISAELTPSESRSVETADLVKEWRRNVRFIAGSKGLSFRGTAGPPGQGFNVQLESDNLEVLQAAAKELKARVATFPGIYDVQDSFDSGQPEIQLTPTPAAEAAGFDRRALARNVRDAFYGREAQRVQRGRDEVKVMVRYPEKDRTQLATLRQMRIRAQDGTAIPFSIVADTKYGEALASIERADYTRIVSVTAAVDKSVTSGQDVLALLEKDFFPAFRANHPEIRIALRGEAEQRLRSRLSLVYGFGLSIVLIYILLAIPLKSYTRPLFIMSVIPFGVTGAMLGHFVFDLPLSILSVFGILALSGVVVNDSLVLMHRLHAIHRGGSGMPLAEAIHQATGERFRPILLTSLTTFAGLIPLLTESAVQAQFLKPMAVSLGFGVLFATGITLVLLPMLVLIADDLRQSFRWWFAVLTRTKTTPADLASID
jgi:multidrug efflux pump subunit AcrB